MSGAVRESRAKQVALWLSITIAAAGVIVAAKGVLLTEEANQAAEPVPAKLDPVLRVREIRSGERGGERIDVTLHNIGGQRALITGARLRVIDVAELPRCFASPIGGGSGPVDPGPSYEATLRPTHSSGDTLAVADLTHSIAPDDDDRFGLDVTIPKRRHGDDEHARWVARLGIVLMVGSARRPVELGEAIVAVPDAPVGHDYYWSTALRSQQAIQDAFNGDFPFASMPCWRSNARKLRRLLDPRGARSESLRKVARELATPWEQ